jgi:hypothetical protein
MGNVAVGSQARSTVTVLFTVMLLLNVVFLTLVLIGGRNTRTLPVWAGLQDDVPVGWRLALVILGTTAAWFSARSLYKLLVRDGGSPDDSVSTAMSLLSFLVVIMLAYAFLTYAAWMWLPILLLVVLIWSTLAIWGVVGGAPVVTALAVAVGVAMLTWYVFA